MAKFYDEIPPQLMEWILKQHMFWVATAALQGDGHVNVSPKATPNCFHIENPTRVWYEDLTGSGIETISHIRQPGNGRVTLLFNAFEGPPRILRLWGKGTVYEFGTPEYDKYIPVSNRKAGSRAVIIIDVHKVGTSCGFGVPLYKFETHRTMLERWCDQMEGFDNGETQSQVQAPPPYSPEQIETDRRNGIVKDPSGIKAWWTAENLQSFDGLPGLLSAHDSTIAPINTFDKKAPHPRLSQTKNMDRGKPTDGGVGKSSAGETSRLLLAFGAGIMVTVGYMRLSALGGLHVPLPWSG